MSDASQEKRTEIFERLKKVLAKILHTMKAKDPKDRPVLDWNSDLMDDLGVDSVESIDVMNSIEEEFQVSPNLSEASSKRRISDIVDYIIELEKSK
jgi:acyl carrier protein